VADRILQRLANGGRTGVFLTALVVILVALLSPGWIGGILLIIVVGLMGALMRRTWPVQTPRTRLIRLGVLVLLTLIAVYKLVGNHYH
jgi:hypothetical protein